MTDALEDGMGAEAAGQLAYSLDRGIPPLADVRRPKPASQCDPVGMTTEHDDLLRTETTGGAFRVWSVLGHVLVGVRSTDGECAVCLNPSDRLGPYEILGEIGAGGMGEVYKARDTRLNRVVAVKVLLGSVDVGPELTRRFEREAQAVAALNHPNICTVYDIGDERGTPYFVMEYLAGETLAARLSRGGLPLQQALQHAVGIADALDKAHRAGVVHRDVKPSNIVLTDAGAKLLDFGLAKLVPAVPGRSAVETATAPSDLTRQGTILGTLQYMAPEQIEGLEADARTDIFAFGAVLYEMVTGTKAFSGKSQTSLMISILERDPVRCPRCSGSRRRSSTAWSPSAWRRRRGIDGRTPGT